MVAITMMTSLMMLEQPANNIFKYMCIHVWRMAEGLAREGIEGEITCPLCLSIYEDPKILPCHHVYCKDPCLVGLARQSNSTTITCPECRGVAQIQNGDVGAFPTAFHINRLKDLHQTMNETTDSLPDSTPNKTCQTHKSQEIAIYCETCKQLLCRDCVLGTDDHNKHNYDYIQKVAEKHCKHLLNKLQSRQNLYQQLSHALVKVKKTKCDIARQKVLLSKDIDTEVDKLIHKLTEQRQTLHSKLDYITTQKLEMVQAQQQQLIQSCSELSECVRVVKNDLVNSSDVEFVSKMSELDAQLEQVTRKTSQVPLSPASVADAHFYTAEPSSLDIVTRQFHLCSGNLADPSKCSFDLQYVKTAEIDQEVNVLVKVCDSNGIECIEKQNIMAEFLCLRDLTSSLLNVTCVKPGQYLVKFAPKARGRHMLSIKVNGRHIVASPVSLFVKIEPQKLKDPVAVITDMRRPAGLTCLNGTVLACELERDQIVVIDSNFQIVRTIALSGSPNELTSDQDSNIYVTTSGDHKLHKLNRSGHCLKTVGSFGNKGNQFHYPNGNCIHENKLYVCDSENHRIKVYDLELNLLKIIGKKGTKLGQFTLPLDVQVNGEMYVTEQDNRRVQVLSLAGQPVRVIGDKSRHLIRPISLHIVGDLVYITESMNASVCVFTTAGDFVTTFGKRYLSAPEGITIDQDGFVYVTSHSSKIFVF